MKFYQFILFALLFFTSCQTENKSKTMASSETGSKIQVIDFYTTHRCKTCLKIENNTKELLESAFKKEMEVGTVSFQTINIDEEVNYDMAERFEAAGTALFINVIKNGQEQHIDLTSFAFMKAFEEEAFSAELKVKIEEQLKLL